MGHFCPPGSGSTGPIEYGSNPDPGPDPKPWSPVHKKRYRIFCCESYLERSRLSYCFRSSRRSFPLSSVVRVRLWRSASSSDESWRRRRLSGESRRRRRLLLSPPSSLSLFTPIFSDFCCQDFIICNSKKQQKNYQETAHTNLAKSSRRVFTKIKKFK